MNVAFLQEFYQVSEETMMFLSDHRHLVVVVGNEHSYHQHLAR